MARLLLLCLFAFVGFCSMASPPSPPLFPLQFSINFTSTVFELNQVRARRRSCLGSDKQKGESLLCRFLSDVCSGRQWNVVLQLCGSPDSAGVMICFCFVALA